MKTLSRLTLTVIILLLCIYLIAGAQSDSIKPAPAHGAFHPMPQDTANMPDSLKPKRMTFEASDTLFAPEDYIVVETHHRMYPNFLQVDTVKFHQRFQLGEEPIWAEAFVFIPDLKITMKGEKMKTSDTLFNPAVQLRVYVADTLTHADSLVQQTWAFYYGGAPHFARNAFFAFTLKDFKVANPRYIKPPERK